MAPPSRLVACWRATTPRGRWVGLLAVLLVAAGAYARYPVVVGVGICLLGLLVAELVAVLRPYAVALRRTVEPTVVVRNDPCHGVLRVASRRRRGLARLEAAELVDGRLVPVRLPESTSAEEVDVTYDVPTPRRGVLRVGPLLVRRHGIAGLATHSAEVGEVVDVRVLPRRIPVTRMLTGARRAAIGTADSLDIGGTDLVGLHEYTQGDDLRRLHWATSARSGTLMVRDDAEPAEPHVCVLLDDRWGSYPTEQHADLFEEAVELAAALCRVTVQGGHLLQFRVVSGRFEVDAPGSPSGLPRAEGTEIEHLLAEIGTVEQAGPGVHGSRAADIVVAVSGSHASESELDLFLGDAPRRVLLSLDPRPLVTSGQSSDLLVLRGGTSHNLADQWDVAVDA